MSIQSLLTTALLLIAVLVQAVQLPLTGWRYPKDDDHQGYWAEYRGSLSVPFHVQGDFDGNGTTDDAWILIGQTEVRFGVFVFLDRGQTDPEVIELVISGVGMQPHGTGLELVPPGSYQTACGKGYWPCGPTEPPLLELTSPALRLLTYEKASEIYYWDSKEQSFRSIAESD